MMEGFLKLDLIKEVNIEALLIIVDIGIKANYFFWIQNEVKIKGSMKKKIAIFW